MDKQLKPITKNIRDFEEIINLFVSSIDAPLMENPATEFAGFRFANPGVKHFCTLKAVRSVSALNAAVVLARTGFNQEVCVLIRTIIECNSQIEYILSGYKNGQVGEKQKKHVDAFFADAERVRPPASTGPSIRQKDIHKEVGRTLEPFDPRHDKERSPAELMSSAYIAFSNYVHARYPEIMDMYGGRPACFHMNGTSGSPKDSESIEMLADFTNSVSLVLAHMIIAFDMVDVVRSTPEIAHWIKG